MSPIRLRNAACAAALALTFVYCAFANRRPLTHADYDSWRQIFSPTLSREGNFAAYALFPQEGNGEIVVRNIHNGKEWRALKEPADKQKTADLVVRSFRDNSEKAIAQAIDFSLAKDGSTLVYVTESAAVAFDGAAFREIASGKAKYSKLVWSEDGKKLAFSGTPERSASNINVWNRGSDKANAVADAKAAGLKAGYTPSDSGPITFSRTGEALFFGVAQRRQAAGAAAQSAKPADDWERASFDLWHYKDDNIQPMQKVRAQQDRNRTYRATWHSGTGHVVQLADREMAEATPNDDGSWALGGDDREYRPMVEYAERYSDAYLVNTATGERKLVAKKHPGRLTWSPDGKHLLRFDGKDWQVTSVTDGREVNITKRIPTKFWNEEQDTPSTRAPYGSAGWTKDGKSVLLYDRFDIWAVFPDGSSAVNATGGLGRKAGVEFRYQKRDPDEKAIDTSRPLLLRAEDVDTRDSGFFSWKMGTPPKKLVMDEKDYRFVTASRDADELLLTAGTFHDFPELQVSDGSFARPKIISNANPQKENLAWGSEEMVHFRNADGVALEGALYKPDNFDPKKKYPMLVYIYERLSQNLHGFVNPKPGHSINIAYYVSNGYLVFTPDIIYNVGYPGPSALKCVLPGVQAVVDRGFVDEKRIGIAGHSWGGYQIAYMITQTDRFRAVEAGAPVANMTSAYDGVRWGSGLPRQFQYEKTQSRIGGTLWQNPIQYVENSPIFHADRVHTPVLMLHNDADDAVPWYQGIEYYLALRRLQKEVYLFVYHGEPHHLDKRPNQKDYTVRMQQFFDFYLKDAPKPEWMERGIPFLETTEGRQAPKSATDGSGDEDPEEQY